MPVSVQCRSSMKGWRALPNVSIVVVGLALSLVQSAPAIAAKSPQPDPTPLWRAFPLRGDSGKQQPHTTVGSPKRSQPRGDSSDSHGGGAERAALMIALGAGMLALLVLISRPRLAGTKKGVMSMSGFIRRDSPSEHEEAHEASRNEEADDTGERGGSSLNEAMTTYSLLRPPDGNREIEHDEAPPIANYEDLGQTVANILKAAEAEATQVLGAARAEAQAIREEAKSTAEANRAALDAEMEGRRSQLTYLENEADRLLRGLSP